MPITMQAACQRGAYRFGSGTWARGCRGGPRAEGLECQECRGDIRHAHPARDPGAQATETGILPIFACHSRGPVWWTEVPLESTATVTGMSWTSNS